MYANDQNKHGKQQHRLRVYSKETVNMRNLNHRTHVSKYHHIASSSSMSILGILITIGCCCINAASTTGVRPPYTLHQDIRVPPGHQAKGIQAFSSLVYAIQSNSSDLSPLKSESVPQQAQQRSAQSSPNGTSSLNLQLPIYHPEEDAFLPQDTIHPPESPQQETFHPQPLLNSESAPDDLVQELPTSNGDTFASPSDVKNDENPIKADLSEPTESLVPSRPGVSQNSDQSEHNKDDYHYEYDNLHYSEEGENRNDENPENLEGLPASTDEDIYSDNNDESLNTQRENDFPISDPETDILTAEINGSNPDVNVIFKEDPSADVTNDTANEDYYSDGSMTEPSIDLFDNSLEPIGMPTSEHIVTVTPPTVLEGSEHMDYYLDYNDTLPSESTIHDNEDVNHDTNYDYHYEGPPENSQGEANTSHLEQSPEENINADIGLADDNVKEVSVFDTEASEPSEESASSQQDGGNTESEILEIQPEILEVLPEEDIAAVVVSTAAPKLVGGSVSVVSYTDAEVDYQSKAQEELLNKEINVGETANVNSKDEEWTTTTTSTTPRPTAKTTTTTQKGYVFAPRTMPSLYLTTRKAVATTEKPTSTESASTMTNPPQNVSVNEPSSSGDNAPGKLIKIDTSFTVSDSNGEAEKPESNQDSKFTTPSSIVDLLEESKEAMPSSTTLSPTQSIVHVIESLNLPEPTLFGEMPIGQTHNENLNMHFTNATPISEMPPTKTDVSVSPSSETEVNISETNVQEIVEENVQEIVEENVETSTATTTTTTTTTTTATSPTTTVPSSTEQIPEVPASSVSRNDTSIDVNSESIISSADILLTDTKPISALPTLDPSSPTSSSKESSHVASYEHAAADNIKSSLDEYSSTSTSSTSPAPSEATTTETTTVTSNTNKSMANETSGTKVKPAVVNIPTESISPLLLPSGFSTEEPVSVLLVPLKSRNLSQGRKLGSLFDQIFERQKANKTVNVLESVIDPAVKNITGNKLIKTPVVPENVNGTAIRANDSLENSTVEEVPATRAPPPSLRRRFPTLSRKPFPAPRSGPVVTRAPFKIATRKTSDILKQPRVTLKPVGRRINPHAEYPSDPDSRPSEATESAPPTTTTKRIVTTLSPYFLWGQSVEVACTLRIQDGVEWTPDLEDHGSPAYQELSNDIGKELDALFKRSDFGIRYKGIQIEGFSRGSVIVDYTLYLTEEDEPVETPLLWEAISKALDNGTNMGSYVVDPGNLSFEVIRKITPPPEVLNDGLLLPHWAIAVIVIAAASLLFLIILCLALTRNKRGVKRKYANVLKEGSITDRAKDWDKSAYDNLGASSSIYDINDTWDEKKLKQQQRSYNNYNLYSVHPPSTGSGHYAPKSTGSGQYGVKKSTSQTSEHYPPEDPYSHGRYYDSWRSDWSRSARGSSKPPDYDTTF